VVCFQGNARVGIVFYPVELNPWHAARFFGTDSQGRRDAAALFALLNGWWKWTDDLNFARAGIAF